MTDNKELWLVYRRDNHNQIGFVRLKDLGLPNKEAAEARTKEVPSQWASHHTQEFYPLPYRRDTLPQVLKENKLELVN